MVIPLMGTPTRMVVVQEPSPVIITGDLLLAVAVVVVTGVIFFFGRVYGSAVSLRLGGF